MAVRDLIQEAVDRLVADAPPLSRGQKDLIRLVFSGTPPPEDSPIADIEPYLLHDPPAGAPYSTRCRAAAGACERCGTEGKRMVDHCHQHNQVRGLVCVRCNNTRESRHGFEWIIRCPSCLDAWRHHRYGL
jgi:Recombination endonuclease VII